ncbi:MAG: kpsD [Fusobacteriales bacterium]|jgi:polysaccharide export outer membrane protein|nr:kpsD [Fusobacteriales bacterium]
MKKNIFFIIFILTMISCSKLNEKTIKNIEFKNENITTKEKEINISSKEEIKEFNKISKESYKIGAGDVLVFIPSKKDFENLTLQVGPDGNINIPDIGIVKVKDKTIEDVEKEINEKITKIYNFLKYTVIVTQFNNNKVYIWGNVEKTGVIYLSQENNLIETISLAGGIK